MWSGLVIKMINKIKNCPICNSKIFILRDEPDGFFMGYSVGCPRYKLNDGIHSRKMAFHHFNSKENALNFWNNYIKGEH